MVIGYVVRTRVSVSGLKVSMLRVLSNRSRRLRGAVGVVEAVGCRAVADEVTIKALGFN